MTDSSRPSRPSLRSLPLLLPLASLAFSLACSSSSSAEPGAASAGSGTSSEFQWQTKLDAPAELELRDLNGSIRTEAAPDDTVTVRAIKHGRASDFGKVSILARQEGNRVVACVLWPGMTGCESGPSVRQDDVHVEVELIVRVPAKVSRVSATTMNGGVTLQGIQAPAKLRSMNGAIFAEGAGALDAETMNGAVRAAVAPSLATGGKPVHLATHNGRVELALPGDADADVEASTMRGKITSAFGDVPRDSAFGVPQRTRFRIGAGSTPARVDLSTMNGDVIVRLNSGRGG